MLNDGTYLLNFSIIVVVDQGDTGGRLDGRTRVQGNVRIGGGDEH